MFVKVGARLFLLLLLLLALRFLVVTGGKYSSSITSSTYMSAYTQ
jgi:hypothetical protein